MSQITIREIKRSDIKDIIEIIKASKLDFPWGLYYNVYRFDEEVFWINFRGRSKYPTLVAEYNGKVIAFATNYPHWEEKNNYYIGLLLTHPEYRGKGAGRKLIIRCLEKAVKEKFDILSLHTWASNRAMRLYQRTGFAWIPGSAVYMINFSPQLLKYDEIKSIIDEPKKLITHLTEPPTRISVNGHIAWMYKWSINGHHIEAIFDNKSKLLLGLKINDKEISLIPPENKEYIEEEEVDLKIIVKETIPALIENKPHVLKPGTNIIKIKAKSKIRITIGDYKFGFNLKTKPRILIKTIPERIVSPATIDLLIINNNKEYLEDEIIILTSKTLKIVPNRFKVGLKPQDYLLKRVHVDGFGKAKIRIGDKEEELIVFSGNYIVTRKDKVESAYWMVAKDEIKPYKIKGLTLWFDVYLGRDSIELEFKDGAFEGKHEQLLMRVTPIIDADNLTLKITFKALKEVSDELRLQFWVEPPIRYGYFLIPVSDQRIVREATVYPAFPKAFSIIRKRIDLGFVGFEFKDKTLLVKFDDALYTMMYSPYGFYLEYNVNVKPGGEWAKDVTLTIIDTAEFSKIFKPVRAVSTHIEGNKFIIRNNWITEVTVKTSVSEVEVEKVLKPDEELQIPIKIEGIGELEVPIEINKMREIRKLQYFSPIKIDWRGSRATYEALEIETTDINGTLKSLKIKGKEILSWSDQPFRTSGFYIPITHGGIGFNARIDNEDQELHLKRWERISENAFQIISKGLRIMRSWHILNDKAIMEEILVENLTGELKSATLDHIVFLSGRFDEVYNREIAVGGEKVLSISDFKLVGGRVKDTDIILYAETGGKQLINAVQQINTNGTITLTWEWTLKPKETKKSRIIISLNKELMKALISNSFIECIT